MQARLPRVNAKFARAVIFHAHEALVRGPSGESGFSAPPQVTDANRYVFDQACRVQAIRGAAELGIKEFFVD